MTQKRTFNTKDIVLRKIKKNNKYKSVVYMKHTRYMKNTQDVDNTNMRISGL